MIKSVDKRFAELDNSTNKRFSELNESFKDMRSDFNKYAQRNDDRGDNHETRITHLEKNHGNSYIAREPRAEYRVKKKKKK